MRARGGGAASLFLLLICAGEASAQERWTTAFRQGFSYASVATRRGEALRLNCDTTGLKPGRGAISLELRAPKGKLAAQDAIDILIVASGQTIRLRAGVEIAAARDEVPGSRRRSGRNDAVFDTRESPTDDQATLTYDLDGSAEAAQPFATLAAAIAKEPREIVARAPALGLEAKFPAAQAARVLRGFEKGCQDSLPAADDELQWDWQQGLDRIDDRPQVTIATSSDVSGASGAPKLMISCADGKLAARLINPPRGGDGRLSLTVDAERGHSAQSTWRGDLSRGDWRLDGDDAARLLAALWRGARATFSAAGVKPIDFPIAGAALATRKLIEACPTPLLPPKE